MYKAIVVSYKLASSEYFLNQMQQWEAIELISDLDITDKPTWEQTRLQLYVQAQANSKKRLKPTDVMKFKWEESEEETEHKTTIDNKEIKALKERAKFIKEKYIDGK